MACGAPVLTSNISSLPELAGDAAILVDSTSTQGIADGMARLGEDTALRARLSAAGRTNAARFSWSRTAAETLAIYRRLLRPA
jgi:glycosyltransferase involved in cell wall biosynthesis